MNPEPMLVLLVEDNEDHAELLKRTLREADHPIRIVHARDGEAALDYLGLSGAETIEAAAREAGVDLGPLARADLLKYLQNTDRPRYLALIQKLGLRK